MYRQNERGAILIIVVLFIMIIAGFSAALMHVGVTQGHATELSVARQSAFDIAEAGTSAATAELFKDYDGADNDGDGLVDEGRDSLDQDGDGVADDPDEFEGTGTLGCAGWSTGSDDTGGLVPGRFSSGSRLGNGDARPNLDEPNAAGVPFAGGRLLTWVHFHGNDGADNDGDGAVDEVDERGFGTLFSEGETQGTVVALQTVVNLFPPTAGGPPGSPQSPIFGMGAFGDQSTTLDSNAIVDSYKSSLGSYSSQATNRFRGNPFALANGDVGSNSTVGLRSNAVVHGDASVPSGGSVSTAGNSSIQGTTTTNATRQSMPVVVMPPVASAAPTSFAVGSNGSATISSGNYHYSSFLADSNSTVTINGPATLVIDDFRADSNTAMRINSSGGPVTIIGTGRFDLNSNASLSPNNANAKDLAVILTGDNIANPSLVVAIDSNSGLVGRVYAPNARLTVNSNAGVTGQVIAKQVHLDSNGAIHFDEDLLTQPFPNVAPPGGKPSHFPTTGWEQLR
ncbi:MAG: hypothetical protein L0216_17525 [Planctomycetales bacterium]|nr:hypothetical protein [Planctomycetales bacterium]